MAWGRAVQASSSGLSRLFPRDVTWVPSPSPPRRKTGRPGPDPEAPVQSADGVRGGSSLSVSDGRRGSGTCWSVALQLARQGRSSSCVTDAHPRPGQGDRLPASPAPGVLVWVDAGLSDPGDGLATGLFPSAFQFRPQEGRWTSQHVTSHIGQQQGRRPSPTGRCARHVAVWVRGVGLRCRSHAADEVTAAQRGHSPARAGRGRQGLTPP